MTERIFRGILKKNGVRTRGTDQKSKDLEEFAFGRHFEWNRRRQ